MSRKLTALIAGLLLFVTAPAFADLQFSNNGTRKGQFRKVDLDATSGLSINDAGLITGSAGSPTFANLTDSGLTAGRVTFAGTAGLLSDDADLTFVTDTLTATKIVAPTSLVINSGTALTTTNQSGTGSIAMTNTPSFTTPAIGAATGASVALTGNAAFQTSLLTNGRYSPGGTAVSITLASSSTGLGGASVPYTQILKGIGGNGVDNNPGSILPNGLPGQTIFIRVLGVEGSGTWKLTPTTATGWTSMTFSARGQNCELVYDATLGWLIAGATAATVNF